MEQRNDGMASVAKRGNQGQFHRLRSMKSVKAWIPYQMLTRNPSQFSGHRSIRPPCQSVLSHLKWSDKASDQAKDVPKQVVLGS